MTIIRKNTLINYTLTKSHDGIQDFLQNISFSFQYHGFFDPVAHLTLSDNEKQQCERYVKNLIFSDIYPAKNSSVDGANTSLTAVSASSSSTVPSQVQNPSFQQTSFKSTTYDDFITACGDYDMVSESSKEKSKRVALNEEFKYFKTAVHAFNLKNKPSVTSALVFWKDHYVQLPLLSNLAKVHLVACGTSVPSESAFHVQLMLHAKNVHVFLLKTWLIRSF